MTKLAGSVESTQKDGVVVDSEGVVVDSDGFFDGDSFLFILFFGCFGDRPDAVVTLFGFIH